VTRHSTTDVNGWIDKLHCQLYLSSCVDQSLSSLFFERVHFGSSNNIFETRALERGAQTAGQSHVSGAESWAGCRSWPLKPVVLWQSVFCTPQNTDYRLSSAESTVYTVSEKKTPPCYFHYNFV